jgi:hypothetical protein
MAIKIFLYLFVIISLQEIVLNQGDCFIGVLDSPHHSLDGAECKKRSAEVGYKCCFISYQIDTNNVEMCFPISKTFELENISPSQETPDNFKVDCFACVLTLYVYISAIFILTLML